MSRIAAKFAAEGVKEILESWFLEIKKKIRMVAFHFHIQRRIFKERWLDSWQAAHLGKQEGTTYQLTKI